MECRADLSNSKLVCSCVDENSTASQDKTECVPKEVTTSKPSSGLEIIPRFLLIMSTLAFVILFGVSCITGE